MSELIQSVKDGKIQTTTSNSKSEDAAKATKPGGELGKDAFLQLLVTQMQYQDPLNPTDNTQYVSQLATFSQLEQSQNMSSSLKNSQAFSLVGKTVILKPDSTATDSSSLVSGRVDYVYVSGSTTKLSVNGKLYAYDELDTVLDDNYVTEQNLPGVPSTKLSYDGSDPKNLSFAVDLGAGDTVAKQVAVAIGNTMVNSSLVTLAGNKVTINKSAFSDLENGTYKVKVSFDDALHTTVDGMATLNVTNSTAKATDATQKSQ